MSTNRLSSDFPLFHTKVAAWPMPLPGEFDRSFSKLILKRTAGIYV